MFKTYKNDTRKIQPKDKNILETIPKTRQKNTKNTTRKVRETNRPNTRKY